MTEPWCQNHARILLTDSEREIEREKERDREILKGKCSLYVSDLEGLRAAHAAKKVIKKHRVFSSVPDYLQGIRLIKCHIDVLISENKLFCLSNVKYS